MDGRIKGWENEGRIQVQWIKLIEEMDSSSVYPYLKTVIFSRP